MHLLLIDFSSLAYPIWSTSSTNPDPNHSSQQMVARVNNLAAGFDRTAICCDSGATFRNELSPAYKANRPEKHEGFKHQVKVALSTLAADGFPIWKAKGFEADDVIASAAKLALLRDGWTVTIATGDKDLLQLVGPRVTVKRITDGGTVDAAAVFEKFGVQPEQMRDYLTLLGDTADNVPGAAQVGGKKAAQLLATFGTVDALFTSIADGTAVLTPALKKGLLEFHPNLKLTRELIALRSDVEIPFDEIDAERVPTAVKTFEVMDTGGVADEFAAGSASAPVPTPAAAAPCVVTTPNDSVDGAQTGMVVRMPDVLPAPSEWERQLDPRSRSEAAILAKHMFESNMFSSYGTPQGVLSTIMVGRELGLPAMASLRSIHNVDGKHSLSSALMAALVLKSGMAEYFEPVEFSATSATFITKRKGARKEISFTYTIEEARKAWKKTQDAWDKSGWGSHPTNMLIARAQAMLARLIYPDLLAGLYTPEELADMREAA